MHIVIRHGPKTHTIQAEPHDQVKKLMEIAEEVTGVLARKQKLVFKGRVLTANMDLEEAKVKEGSTIMLIAATSQMTQVSWQNHASQIQRGDRHCSQGPT